MCWKRGGGVVNKSGDYPRLQEQFNPDFPREKVIYCIGLFIPTKQWGGLEPSRAKNLMICIS
jgi:hypothetical protein